MLKLAGATGVKDIVGVQNLDRTVDVQWFAGWHN